MSDDRSWLTADYPELRDGPPWVMEEMILAERDLPAGILGGAGKETAGVSAAIREAVSLGAPIVVTGCGTSEHGAMAVAELIADAQPDAWVEAREALDAAVRPRRGGLCIGISHDGGTRATRLALEAAREGGRRHRRHHRTPRGERARRRGPCRRDAARRPLVVPHRRVYERDRGRGGDRRQPCDSRAADRSDRRRRRAAPAIRRRGEEGPRRPHGSSRPASEPTSSTARELALKIEEGARIPANAHRLETVLHGHLAGCDADRTAVVRFAVDTRGGDLQAERGADLDAALEVIGIPTVAIGEPFGLAPAESAAEALVVGAVALQLLTLELAHAAGTNPDLIRREQQAYREAAAAAERADG